MAQKCLASCKAFFFCKKNVSVIANYVQIVLCYSNIIKGNVIPKTKMKRRILQ